MGDDGGEGRGRKALLPLPSFEEESKRAFRAERLFSRTVVALVVVRGRRPWVISEMASKFDDPPLFPHFCVLSRAIWMGIIARFKGNDGSIKNVII